MPDEPFELPPDLLGRIPLFAELAKVLSWSGGPVNWDLARQIAVALAAGEETVHEVPKADGDEITEAFRLAEMWLAEGPGLATPAKVAVVRATTPARWAERATALSEIVDPLAAKVVASVRDQSAGLRRRRRGRDARTRHGADGAGVHGHPSRRRARHAGGKRDWAPTTCRCR